MATDGRSKAIIETSVLLNFLRIDRADLLARHPTYRFVVPAVVRDEVGTKPSYAAQSARLEAAFAAGDLLPDASAEATSIEELAIFAALTSLKRTGVGERASLAAAYVRGLPLAMDDPRAWTQTASYSSGLPKLDTVGIVLSLVLSHVLTVEEADAIKLEWEKHSFIKADFKSFGDLLTACNVE